MWGLTLADLRYRYRQFLIAVLGAGVVLAMALLLAGLAGGFRQEISRTIGSVGADRWVLADNAGGRIAAVATFPESDVGAISASPGVAKADPLVIVPQEVALIGRSTKTVNVFGVQIGGMGDPIATSGAGLSGPGEVVAGTASGARPGQNITVGATHFKVVGLVRDRTLLGGAANLYMTLGDAQGIALGGRPLVTAVVTRGVPSVVPSGLTSLTVRSVEHDQLSEMSAGVKSIDNSKVFMWVVAAIIVAALLYVSALQRLRDFAVLKALGSSSADLFASLAAQAVVVAFVAAGFAMVISNFMGGLFAQPVAIPASAYATMPLVAVGVGIISSLIALRRITGADPAAAFGG